MDRRATGHQAEETALEHLSEQGLELLERNFRCKMGEIDLIMRHDDTLIFVEVRYRNDTTRGTGAESITRAKIRRIIKTAEYFLLVHPEYHDIDCRFDVVSLDDSIDWIQNAFTLDT